MTEDVDVVNRNELVEDLISREKEILLEKEAFSEKELDIIAEKVMEKIYGRLNNLDILEPKTKVIDQKEFSVGVKFFGYFLLISCVVYWIYFFFVVQDIVPLTHTTYLTLILISLTFINKFESVLLNSFTAISFVGFLIITIFLIPVSRDVYSFLGGVILHGAMAGFQFYLVLNKRIVISKRYLIIGYMFYIFFLSSYDNFGRLIAITETGNVFTELMVLVNTFYIFSLSAIGIYLFKKKFGMLVP